MITWNIILGIVLCTISMIAAGNLDKVSGKHLSGVGLMTVVVTIVGVYLLLLE